LRDLQMAHWLKKLADKGLVVTAFLDCCHSGGMTRGDAVARGSDEIDLAVRPAEQAARDDAALATWRALTGGDTRSATLSSSGLPASDDWVVVAACRPQESAYESSFDGGLRSGALSHWLLDALQGDGLTLSYKQLHQRLMARVQAQFAKQRPQLFGDGTRAVLGRDRVKAQFAVPVIQYDEQRKEVVLNAGIAQGVRRGAEFAIFALSATDLGDFDTVAAHVTITDEGATDSRAKVDAITEGMSIEPGAQAVLVNPASVKLRSYVRLQTTGEGALSAAAQAALKAAHEMAQFAGFVEWVVGETSADFIVATKRGFYEIWDTSGEVIPRINPQVAVADADAAGTVIERLIHLTRYRNVQQLANSDSQARGAPSVTFEWVDVPTDHVFADGDVAKLLVRNDSPYDAEITVLALGADWSIEQIYPDSSAEAYGFAPGESDTLEFDTYIDGDGDEEVSIYKVFATVRGTNFRMLELPSLDAAMTRGIHTPTNELEELLANVVETVPSTRAGRMRSSAGRQWATAQVELRVHR
jgi:hypothetical protein